MRLVRVLAVIAALVVAPALRAGPSPEEVLSLNTRLVLELVRHTPTYSPPVASRAFAYLYVAAWETMAAGDPTLRSLAGQLRDLGPLPAEAPPDRAAALQAAMATAMAELFANTGPTGQRAMTAMAERLTRETAEGLDPAAAARSRAIGERIAQHILEWARNDGGHKIENMGFPHDWPPPEKPGDWVPTSDIVQQQAPLLPAWGHNRPFAVPAADACDLPPPPAYSEEPGSAFRAQAEEVLTVSRTLTEEQRLIARFWSDDPMLSPTPPGHWIRIAEQVLEAAGADAVRRAEVLAVLSVAMADAFIACWDGKYRHNLLRPVTYIRAHLDPDWEPLLITPPFPEYPSGHSTLSGAAAEVLTAFFGENYPFSDRTHEDDGLPPRRFPSFRAAAEEAAMSRLYGGIHFRAANENGLAQGRCVGAHAARLRTRA